MSRDIDFPISNFVNFTQIFNPNIYKNQKRQEKKKQTQSNTKNVIPKTSRFQIKQSFVPQQKSSIPDQFQEELKDIKQRLQKQKDQEKKTRQKLAQGKITIQQLQNNKQKQVQPAEKDNIKIDQGGRARDQQGNLVFIENQATNLKINLKKQEQTKLKQLVKKQKTKHNQRISRDFFDRNLLMSGRKRSIRKKMLGLQFLEKGSYKTLDGQANSLLHENIPGQQQLHQPSLKQKIIKKRTRIKIIMRSQTPNVQWWDQPLLLDPKSYPDNMQINEEKQTIKQQNQETKNCILKNKLVQPISFQKVGKQDAQQQNIIMPMYLTKDQRKKLKRKKKKQRLQQKNDKIKLGLIQPDKPKLKISNMAVVLKDQFILDPSKIQALAKRQMEQRLNKHLESNNSRKLSKAKKQEKTMRKLKRDSAKECRRVLFKLGYLEDPTQVFKINMNAKQLALNGMVIKPNSYHQQPVLIIIEGGQKAVKFYKNLMLNRINWQSKNPKNYCKLVWQGVVENTNLGKWRTHEVSDQPETLKILSEKGIGHFWDYVVNA